MGIRFENPLGSPRLYPISRKPLGTDNTPKKEANEPETFLNHLKKISDSPETPALQADLSPSTVQAKKALELSQRMALQMNESLLRIVFDTQGETPLETSFLDNLKDLLSPGEEGDPLLSTIRHSPSENPLSKTQRPDLIVGKPIQPQKSIPGPQGIDKIIQKASQAHGVDPDLIRGVIQAESSFNPKAISPKGAMGLMQLMPKTAKELGVSDPLNPVENVMGGTRYLRKLLDRYEGSVPLALAAYNWGMGNLDSRRSQMPAETKNYVAKITGITLA